MITATAKPHEGRHDGRHPGCAGQAGFPTLQRGKPILKHLDRWIARAAIHKAGFLVGKTGGSLCGIIKYKTGRRKDGFTVLLVLRTRH